MGSRPDPMTVQSRQDINNLGQELLYQTHQTASGWGLRALTPDEVGIAFQMPAFQRSGGFDHGQLSNGPIANNGRNPKSLWQGKIPPDTFSDSHSWSSLIQRKTKLATFGLALFVSHLD